MKLSVLIPARNEEFLGKTIENILENIEDETEVIAVLDGYDVPVPLIPEAPNVTIIKNSTSVGQRAATNQACRLSTAKYVMKVDAHCSFAKGFDKVMIEDMQDDWTMVPVMRNLHAFDWVCKNGHRRYQGPSGACKECGEPTVKDIIWHGKESPQSTSYRFDNTLHFQYWGEYKKNQIGDLVETMSLQGSCFMLTREKYWELDICDEGHGSWGQQGTEVACKTWLSGGRVIVNKKTWYAHMFRTQGGDFGFPYPNPGIGKAREYSKELWLSNKWPKAKYPLSWLINKFNPPGWDVSKGLLYYTDSEISEDIAAPCREQLKKCAGDNRIVSVSLKPLDFGDNIVLDKKRGYLTMAEQILTGLKELDTDIVYLCEHDVFYDKSHFDYVPQEGEFAYNMNSWIVRDHDGFAVYYDHKCLSGLVAWRKDLIAHWEERVQYIKDNGFSVKVGFEPFTHNRIDWKTKFKCSSWKSENPNIDIKHEKNFTKARWSPSEFRSQNSCKNWKEGRIYWRNSTNVDDTK